MKTVNFGKPPSHLPTTLRSWIQIFSSCGLRSANAAGLMGSNRTTAQKTGHNHVLILLREYGF
jgi:hypothetical protein